MKLNIAFNYFSKRVKYYLKEFGLINYEVFIKIDKKTINRGTCTLWHNSGKTVYIDFGKKCAICSDTTTECIDKVAFHEVFELLLFDLRLLAETTFSKEKIVDKAIHNVIRIMENTVFNYMKDTNKKN